MLIATGDGKQLSRIQIPLGILLKSKPFNHTYLNELYFSAHKSSMIIED